jgi:hypothetical protein
MGSIIPIRESRFEWYKMHFQMIVLFTPPLVPRAYLDPGSGSFLIQLLIAGIVGAGFLVKMYWKKIKGLFNRSSLKNEEDDADIKQ